MITRITIKAKDLENGTLDNHVKVTGDPNVIVNALLDTLNMVCKDNNIDINKVCKTLKEYHKYVKEEK